MSTAESTRILQVKGGYNFRDLGGLKTKDGKTIRKNLLFRTDELSTLLPEDLTLLESLNIQTVIDFRTDQERAKSVDKLPTTCKREIQLNIIAANMDALVAEIKKGNTDFKGLMMNLYEELVLGDNAIKEYTKFFELLQDANNLSVIYHCTAGKDRTGVATALILEALQVDWKDIEADYMLSNIFLAHKYDGYMKENPALGDLFLVRPEYLKSAIDVINAKYQSVENYLVTALQVDIKEMRKMYLI